MGYRAIMGVALSLVVVLAGRGVTDDYAEVHRADDWQQQHVLRPGDWRGAGSQGRSGVRRQTRSKQA